MAALTATMSKHCWALNDVLANCMGNSGYEALSVRLAAGMFSVTLAVAMSVTLSMAVAVAMDLAVTVAVTMSVAMSMTVAVAAPWL